MHVMEAVRKAEEFVRACELPWPRAVREFARAAVDAGKDPGKKTAFLLAMRAEWRGDIEHADYMDVCKILDEAKAD